MGRLCPLLGRREKWGIIGRGAHHVYGTSTDRDTDGSINFKNGNSSKNKTRNDTQYNKMRHRYKVFPLQFSGFYFIFVGKSFQNVVVNSAARKQSHQTEMRKTL